MATLGPAPKAQFFYANGEPLVGGKVYTYAAGTTTPQVTYTDASGSTANPNPIILDSRGECNIWFSSSSYKIKLTDSNDVEIYTVDDVTGAGAISNGTVFASAISNSTFTAGSINNTYIGNTNPSTGVFTALSATSVTATSISGAWDSLPAGTKMLFVQSAAPTGWTKSLADNNKALRVVSGTAGTGGSVAFTTAFSAQGVSGSTDAHVLTLAEIPSHAHSYTAPSGAYLTNNTGAYAVVAAGAGSTTGAQGGGGGHSHTFTATSINLAVEYVDVIIAVKN